MPSRPLPACRPIIALPLLAFLALVGSGSPALAADAGGHGFVGAELAGWWAVPFAGLLLSIALMPLLVPDLWHHHYGKIALGWAALVILPMLPTLGLD
ncbi:sodium:proton antiporter, partial [Geminicoccus flavidas]|uniref:sodium:proton antiporter n=1 Tax=Geminicoccus flavidas TaxID=2506407 RepID=UPI001F31E0CA